MSTSNFHSKNKFQNRNKIHWHVNITIIPSTAFIIPDLVLIQCFLFFSQEQLHSINTPLSATPSVYAFLLLWLPGYATASFRGRTRKLLTVLNFIWRTVFSGDFHRRFLDPLFLWQFLSAILYLFRGFRIFFFLLKNFWLTYIYLFVIKLNPLFSCTDLGVGPFGVVAPEVLGVEGVRGAIRGWFVEELMGLSGPARGWGVEGALVLPDARVVWGAEGVDDLGVVGFPQPSRVLRVILRGWVLDLILGVLFFSSRGVGGGASLPCLDWDEASGIVLDGWDKGDEFLDAFLPFFSTPLFGTKTSKVGGSFSGVPSSPGEKDRKEQ